MKNFIKFLIFVGVLYFVNKSCSFKGLLFEDSPNEQVAVADNDLATALDENEHLASEATDLRKDLFSILLALNGITDETLVLERSRETDGYANRQNVAMQIHARMDALRDQLADARQRAGNSEQLQQEIDRLEKSFIAKKQEIKRLTNSIAKVDDDIEKAVEELEVETSKLKDKESELKRVNEKRRATINEKTAIDQRAWIFAGDELVRAARIIPRPSIGRQSNAIVDAKKLLLRSAWEDCYDVAIRINPRTSSAADARYLSNEARSLYQRASNRKDIGEKAIIYDED